MIRRKKNRLDGHQVQGPRQGNHPDSWRYPTCRKSSMWCSGIQVVADRSVRSSGKHSYSPPLPRAPRSAVPNAPWSRPVHRACRDSHYHALSSCLAVIVPPAEIAHCQRRISSTEMRQDTILRRGPKICSNPNPVFNTRPSFLVQIHLPFDDGVSPDTARSARASR